MTDAERFARFVSNPTSTGCLPWAGSRSKKDGYGRFGFSGRNQRAHRVAWELYRGPIPAGSWVLHRCDNPPCVNPDHLFLGTRIDNVRDMEAKGRARHPTGEKHRISKLSTLKVQIIRFLARETALTMEHIGLLFGVNKTTVSYVARRRWWRGVPDLAIGGAP